MNKLFHRVFLAGGIAAFSLCARAQVIELRATINAAQETTTSTSPATGTAIMLYDVSNNTYDLVVSISNLANTISNSHLHEAAAGVAGGVVSSLGAESVYTRNGNTVSATFRGLTYGGDKLKLLQSGAYYNLHTAAYPGGEVRGQLIARPKRLVANVDVAQEQATTSTTINSNAKGAAVMYYDPAAGRISLRVNLYGLTNTFTNSHVHEAARGVSGGVATGLGGPTAYTNNGGGFYSGSFDIPYTGDPVKLLTGGAYLNFHTSAYAAGEIRGQLWASEEIPGSRVVNLAARGQVGTGSQVLIQGFGVTGPEPVRFLITAKGPSLSAYGLTGVLADPVLWLYDSAGRLLATNNDIGAVIQGSELASIPGVPSNMTESSLLVVLPPGLYTAIVGGNNGGTGIALLEVYELRNLGSTITTAGAATGSGAVVY